jgi:hypothetical protein
MPLSIQNSIADKTGEPLDYFEIETPDGVERFDLYMPADSLLVQTMVSAALFKPGRINKAAMRSMRDAFDLIAGCLAEQDRDRFQDMISDPDRGVSSEALSEIIVFVIEAVAGNPTDEPSGSQPTRSNNGRASTAGARSKASTPSRSRSTGS